MGKPGEAHVTTRRVEVPGRAPRGYHSKAMRFVYLLDSDHALEDVTERVWSVASALVTPLLRR